jgi:acyl-CoA dehydrogenase
MPKISPTEAAALQAGTVGFDGEIFTGKPSLQNLVDKYDIALTADEKAFMDNQVQKFCSMIDDYHVSRDRDLPKNVWDFMKQEKVQAYKINNKYEIPHYLLLPTLIASTV